MELQHPSTKRDDLVKSEHIQKFYKLYAGIMRGGKPATNMVGDLSPKFGFYAKGKMHARSKDQHGELDMYTRHKFVHFLEDHHRYLTARGPLKVQMMAHQPAIHYHGYLLLRQIQSELNGHRVMHDVAINIKFDSTENGKVVFISFVDQTL